MSADQPGQYLAVLKAVYDYEATSEEEVSMKEDQILFLLERTDDDWWKVQHKTDSTDDENAPAGLVPASYLEETEAKSVAKALYDYEAATKGELSVSEGEELLVYDQEDDWLLVKTERDGGLAGYVPANYVEEGTGEEEEETPAQNKVSQIVVPDSPPLPPSIPYMDPADRAAAAANKAKADDIQTWSISEVDKKGKKKKGTLGIGNGAIFFASESDKTPVQKWQTSDVGDIKVEKSKHLYIEIGGSTPASLHYNAGSKDIADAIVRKLEASQRAANGAATSPTRALSPPPAIKSPSPTEDSLQRPKKNGVSVRFSPAPDVIPAPETPEGDEEEEVYEQAADGEAAVVLYDFAADGEDELSVTEGEQLYVLDRVSSEEWWKCRNAHGAEGVVPGSYIELTGEPGTAPSANGHNDSEAREQAAREEAARVAAEAQRAREVAAAQREEENRKREAERRAKAAAVAKAEQERKEREAREREAREAREAKERAAADARATEAAKRVPLETATSRSRESKSSSSNRESQPKFPSEEKTRIWHDHSGQWKTEAEFLGISKGKIRLHKINGVIIEVPPEKMAPEDVRYIESMTGTKLTSGGSGKRRPKDDDDVPLGELRKTQEPSSPRPPVPSKRSNMDWLEFFLNAGCEIDDSTRYASSFERDKIDEAILPDIKESTLRTLGLREGDIIRVTKAIEQRKGQPSRPRQVDDSAQIQTDEAIARALQEEENREAGKRHNLFTSPGGAIKVQQRRGRPKREGSGPPLSVDANALSTASEQLTRTASPRVASPTVAARAGSPAVTPAKPVLSTQSIGFDDNAWTNRPSSTKPAAPTPSPAPAPSPAPPPVVSPSPAPTPPAVVAPPPVAAPPAPPPAPPAPAPPVTTTPAAVTSSPAQPTQSSSQADIFAQIARLRPPSAPAQQQTFPSISPQPVMTQVPQSYHSGLGMTSSPLPIGQHLQNQQTGMYQQPINGPRGPLAPVPSNQGLLNPLTPVTGFNQFIPTRPASNPPLTMQPTGFQPSPQPSFLSSPPVGFGNPSPIFPQQTGFPGLSGTTGSFGGFAPQPTGFANGFSPSSNPSFMPPNGFGMQPQPTGFNPGFNQSNFGQTNLAPPRAASPPKDHSPANIFAQMKAGTFADESAPQSADKYDALRPQPTGWQAQPYQQGYGGY